MQQEGAAKGASGTPSPVRRAVCASWRLQAPAGYPSDSRRQLETQGIEGCGIGLRRGTNDNVSGHGDHGQYLLAHDLAEAALESIAFHDRVPVLRNDDTDSWMTQKGSEEPNLEVLGPSSLPFT